MSPGSGVSPDGSSRVSEANSATRPHSGPRPAQSARSAVRYPIGDGPPNSIPREVAPETTTARKAYGGCDGAPSPGAPW